VSGALTLPLAAEITTLGKTVLVLVAGAFIVWALYVSMIYPKKHPEFPRDRNLFIVVTALFFVVQMGAVVWVTGTQEVEHETTEAGHGGEEAGGEETTETETHETETTETHETETEGTPGPEGAVTTEDEAGGAGDAAAGKEVFTATASPSCGGCHTLADARASGSVGPNLDDAKPSAELVVDRVTNGQGVMPAYADSLTEEQIADVAAYVSSVAGG
jgi:cytochrome c553